jgi:AraC-like DNA-binding protein
VHIHSMPSATGGIARLVYERLHRSSLKPAPLLSKAGLTIDQINDQHTRIKVKSQIRFLELAATALRDDLLGLHLASDYDLRKIGLLYYVLASSDVLDEALHRAARYSRITNEAISLTFRPARDAAIALDYVGIERRSDRHQIEFWLVSFVRLCRQLTNRRLIPSRVRVVHHRDRTPAELRSLLGCEVEFGANVDEVVFPSTVKQMPIGSADCHLNELLVKYCEEALSNREPGRITLRSTVEKAMAPLLPHGKARVAEVARKIGMSPRTLARRLAEEGLTFSEIADQLKADLAQHYLRDGDLPISQVAWLLGYREVSAFTHAYRRWTGMTPRQSRTHGNDGPAGRVRTSRSGSRAGSN